jgi:hypothetical protein
MRVLFIDPPVPYKPRKEVPGMNINLSIATLSPILVQHAHQVSLFDMVNHYDNNLKTIANAIKVFKPDVLCVSILNVQYLGALEVIKELKKRTSLPIIVGGPEV